MNVIKAPKYNGDLWGENIKYTDSKGRKYPSNTPFEYIQQKTRCDKFPIYITEYFKEMNDRYKEEKDYVKNIYCNIDNFKKRFNERLMISSDKYFGLNQIIDNDF